ncbi:MAG: polysaccharide biosynthesis C-terminal domain-containing protein [Flavobacteriales bacterium]|jgi:O-antigen/teichoic acid export membrane protein|nr:polysaccharide biosynthesis C-terminal domain-containing protein [Flavobacteriales bacterium]
MQRTFLTNLALVLALNLLVKPFYIFGIDAEVQVRAGTAAYGGYAALLSLSFLLNILLDLGITNWNTRNIAQHTQLMRKHVSGIIAARSLLAVLYSVGIFLAAWILGYRGGQLELLAILVLNQVLVSTILYLRSNIAGSQRFAQDSLLSVLDRVLLIGICAWLLWGRVYSGPFPIEWFAWAQTAAYGTTAVIALIMVAHRAGGLRPRWDRAFTFSILRQSFPFALLVLLMSFYYRTDSVMLERMLPDGDLQAGIYAQGFRFFEAFNMLGFLFAGLLLPMYSRMLKNKEDVGPLTGLALRLVLAGTLAVAVIGSFYAKAVMDLRYTEHTDLSAPAFAVLIWCFVGVCITYIFGTLLTASGDLRTLNKLAAGGMVLNIGLNLVLIPQFHAYGAALASLITQGAMAVAQMVVAARRYSLSSKLRDVLGLGAYLGVLLGAAFALREAGAELLIAAPALAAIAAAGALATGLVPVRGLRSLLPLRNQG